MNLVKGVIAMGFVTAILAFFGCATKLVGGEIKSDAVDVPGLRYYVAKDILVVSGEITRKAVRGIYNDPDRIGFGGYEEVSTGQVALRAVPDMTRTFLLQMNPGGTADNTLDVTLKDSGLLTKINLNSTDKSAEIVANTVKFAARIAATAAGVPTLPGAGLAATGPSLKDLIGNLEGAGLLQDDYARWIDLNTKYRSFYGDLLTAQEKLSKAVSDEEIKKANAEIAKADDGLARFDTLRTKAREVLLAEYEAFKTRQKVGAVEDKRTFSLAINLADAKAAGDDNFAPITLADVNARVANLPSLKRLWDDVGVIVTAVPVGGTPSDPSGRAVYDPEDKGKTKTPIYYRGSRPMRISVWVKDVLLEQIPAKPAESDVTKAPVLRLASESIFDVRDEIDPPMFVAFDEKAFSTQNVDVGFDDRGNLITFKRTGTSSVAALTKALADAAANAPTEYQAGVTALGSAAAERDKQAAAISTQRKAALDAEIAQLDAEVKLLEARKKYKEAVEAAKKAADSSTPPSK